MKTIRCFNSRPCPFRGEFRGYDEIDEDTTINPRANYACHAPSLEAMQPCLLAEDSDLSKFGIKILVQSPDGTVKAWDPRKVLIQRLDRDEMIDGEKFEV